MAGCYMSVRLYFHELQASENTAQEHNADAHVCMYVWYAVTQYTAVFYLHIRMSYVQVPLNEYEFSGKKLSNVQSQVGSKSV